MMNAVLESNFMRQNISLLLDRYEISECQEECCIEYFLAEKKNHKEVSKMLMLSLNQFAHQIHVNRFYPELFKQAHAKYLSAACFYMIIHHFAHTFNINDGYTVFLQTHLPVYEDFYARLKDFNFQIKRFDTGDNVNVLSDYIPSSVDTSMVFEKLMDDSDIGFGVDMG